MADTPETPPPSPVQTVPTQAELDLRASIEHDTSEKVSSGINAYIAEEKRKIRDGFIAKKDANGDPVKDADGNVVENKDPSVLEQIVAFFKSLIFKIAEYFGMEDGLANLAHGMGLAPAVPDADEIKKVSDQVAKSTTAVLTDKEILKLDPIKDKDKIAQIVQSRVEADLTANASQFPSFEADQLHVLAVRAANGASDQFKAAKVTFNPETIQVDKAGNAPQKLDHILTGITNNIIGAMDKELKGKGPEVISSAQKAIVAVGTKLITEHPELTNDSAALTKAYVDALKNDPAASQGLKNLDMSFDNPAQVANLNNVMSMHLSANIKGLHAAVTGKTEAGQTAGADVASDYEGSVKNTIQKTMVETLRKFTADKVVKNYDDSFWTAPAYRHVKDTIAKVKALDPNAPETPETKAEREKLCDFAMEHGKGFSTAQREKIAEIYSEAMVEVLKKPENVKLSSEELAATIRDNVEDKLKARQAEIDAVGGPSVASVNKKLGMDSLAEIAKQTEEKLKDPNNTEYKTIVYLQQQLHPEMAKNGADKAKQAADQVKAKAGDHGIKGGHDATPPNNAAYVVTTGSKTATFHGK